MRYLLFTAFLLAGLFLQAQPGFEKDLQTRLIMAKDGDIIEIPSGNYQLTKTLSLESKKRIRIKGAGIDKTVLSFKGQVQGAEGLRVSNASDIILQDFTIQDAKGDCIKTMHVDRITFLRVKAEWTGKPKKTNGSYALYPVQCTRVMIDSCTAIGASDAGIYVGQSHSIVVRNCRAYHNVAGIEIENSTYADVYQNVATENTGGILIFDLPDLQKKKGGNVRVFNNDIFDNDLPNFAPKGNIVAKVPDGTGVLVLATSEVEVFNNRILKNNTAGCAIISYYMTENPIKDSAYDPYPRQIYIHSNQFERDHVRPTMKGRFGKLFRFKLKFGKDVPHVLWDGIVPDMDGKPVHGAPDQAKICVRQNINQSIANMSAAAKFKLISREQSPFDCSLPRLKDSLMNPSE